MSDVTEPRRSDAGAPVTVRYWASARAAAGTDEDRVGAGSVADVVAAAVELHPDLARPAASASFLVDGVSAGRDAQAPAGSVVEILPPFAGG